MDLCDSPQVRGLQRSLWTGLWQRRRCRADFVVPVNETDCDFRHIGALGARQAVSSAGHLERYKGACAMAAGYVDLDAGSHVERHRYLSSRETTSAVKQWAKIRDSLWPLITQDLAKGEE